MKKIPIKLIIFMAIIVSQMLPLLQTVSKAQASQCCNINCRSNTDIIVCPTSKESRICKNNSIECCKEERLNASKDEIVFNKRELSQRTSKTFFNQILFFSFHISLDRHPSFFYRYPQNEIQNLPIFLVNSVYLI